MHDWSIAVDWVGDHQSRPEAFRAGRALLRTLAAEAAGVAVDAVDVTAVCPDCGGPHGRPMTNVGVHVSLSRARGVIVAAASQHGPIGIDVERLDGTDCIDGRDERERAIEALTGHASLRHWTRVEAVLKADGRGLRVDPSLVRVEGGEAWVTDRAMRYRLTEPSVHPTLIVSLAQALDKG